MSQPGAKLRCQRIGCDSTFTEDDNPEGSCRYHDSGPIFHDGMKEWSCCRKRSHDFSLFLEIPGSAFWLRSRISPLCTFSLTRFPVYKRIYILWTAYGIVFICLRCKTGKHTTDKPVLVKPAPKNTTPAPVPASAVTSNPSSTEACSRCKQGFFCSDHGSAARNVKQESANAAAAATVCPPKKIIGINEPQVCKNKGCGKTFKEKDNHDTACEYHPGPAVFHDRLRGWKCCDVHVKEFDEFMGIPPCTRGWHNADPTS